MRILWKTAIALACVGMVAPHPQTLVAGQSTQSSRQGVQISDVSLRTGGVLVGQVVDVQGKSLQNAPVAVVFGEKTIAQTKTDRNGRFVVRNLRGGVHQIKAGTGSTNCRFWTAKAAPPASRTAALIVSDGSIVRGQGCATEPVYADGCAEGCSAGGVAGAGAGMLGGAGMGGAGGLAGLGGGLGAGTGLALLGGVAVVGGVLAVTADDDDDAPASP